MSESKAAMAARIAELEAEVARLRGDAEESRNRADLTADELREAHGDIGDSAAVAWGHEERMSAAVQPCDGEGLSDAVLRVVRERDEACMEVYRLDAVIVQRWHESNDPRPLHEWMEMDSAAFAAWVVRGRSWGEKPGAAHAEAAAVYSEVAALTAGPRDADGRDVDDVGHGALHPAQRGGV